VAADIVEQRNLHDSDLKVFEAANAKT